MSHQYEILAPAGSVEQLVAAVNNGCDSVYLGLENFNARMKAPNFSLSNLSKWVDYCHFFGVKVYVTINTSLKNSEFECAKETVLQCYKNNVDGVIVTDLALMNFAASLPKPFEVVASTQLNVHDGFGARFVKKNGATTVVCARECSLDEVSQIVSEGVKTECFLHGALCVCQSGQCLFSSIVGGNSGNRGLCAQPCRKLYKSDGGNFTEGGYLLSAADICGLSDAKKLWEQGVSVFKIEGRNRSAEYAGATSQVYSQVFANGFVHTEGQRSLLSAVYNRGGLNANRYLHGQNSGIVYPFAQNHSGVEVGRVHGNGVICSAPIKKGDGLKIFDNRREVCGAVALQDGTDFAKAEFFAKVADGMTVCRTSSVQLNKEIAEIKRKVAVEMNLFAEVGKNAVLTLRADNNCVTVHSDEIWQEANKLPTTQQEIVQQLCKIGDTQYTISNIVVQIGKIFVSKGQINALRRKGLEQLTAEIVKNYNAKLNRNCEMFFDAKPTVQKGTVASLVVVCKDRSQLKNAKILGADILIYKPSEIKCDLSEGVRGISCFVDLPSFSDNTYIEKLFSDEKLRGTGIVCHNVGQVQLAREKSIPYIAGSGLNIFNDAMAQQFSDAVTFFYSSELTLSEISQFQDKSGLIFVDGEIVLMKLVHCPYKVVYACDCDSCQAHKALNYTDELGNKFALRRRRDGRCTFELINGVKLSAAGKLTQPAGYCVDFDERVVEHYLNLQKRVVDNYCETQPYTKGRLFNKIN